MSPRRLLLLVSCLAATMLLFAEQHGTRVRIERVLHSATDVLAAADYLATKDYVDPTRMGLFGHSRGGMITVRLLQKCPKRFQAAVQVSALLDFVAYMSYKSDSRRRQIAEDKGFDSHLYDNAPGGHSFLFADSPESRDAQQRSHAWLAKYLRPLKLLRPE